MSDTPHADPAHRASAPGWAIATFDASGVRRLWIAGQAHLPSATSVTPETRFRWFSVTKLVTAAAVMKAREQAQLDLDEDVRDRLPWFRPRARVTVRHLLSHASGLANPSALGWVHPPGSALRSDAVLVRETYDKYPRLRSSPGAIATYTNLGYLVLGELLAQVHGAYADAALPMLEAAGARANFDERAAATGHETLRSIRTLAMAVLFNRRTPGLVAYVRDGWVGMTEVTLEGRAYGGLLGSIDDLVGLGRAFLVPDVMLSKRSLTAMARLTASGPRGNYGLGFWHHGDGWIGHGGEAGGYRAELHLHPERSVGMAMLANGGVASTAAMINALKRQN